MFLVAVAVAAFAYVAAADALAAAESKPLRPDPRLRTAPPPRIGPARAIILSVMCRHLHWPFASPGGLGQRGRKRRRTLWCRSAVRGGIARSGICRGAIFHQLSRPRESPCRPGPISKGPRCSTSSVSSPASSGAWGLLAAWVSVAAPVSVQAGPALTYAFLEGAAVLAAIWGLLIWKDLAANSRSRIISGWFAGAFSDRNRPGICVLPEVNLTILSTDGSGKRHRVCGESVST